MGKLDNFFALTPEIYIRNALMGFIISLLKSLDHSVFGLRYSFFLVLLHFIVKTALQSYV